MTVKRNERPLTLTLTGERLGGQYRAIAFAEDAWLTTSDLETLLALVRAFLSASGPFVHLSAMAVSRLRRALGDKKPWRLVLWVDSDEYELAPGTKLAIDRSFGKLPMDDRLLKRAKTAVLRGMARHRKKINKR